MNINNVFINLIVFIIIIFIGLVTSKVMFNIAKKSIKEFELARILKKADIRINPNDIIPRLIKYSILALAVITALNFTGTTLIFVRMIFSLMMILLAFYILISMKNLIPNIYYGIMAGKKYRTGGMIKYKNIEGRIIGMNLAELQVNAKKEIIYIPYKLLK